MNSELIIPIQEEKILTEEEEEDRIQKNNTEERIP